MKLSERWLREWLAFPGSFADWAGRFTQAGLEVVGPAPAYAHFSGVVTARIVSTAPHPDAARLQICQVDCGLDGLQQIVCGAPNARPEITVALARPGAVLPGDKRIEAATLRGVASAGMLCGGDELGLDDRGDGLLELPNDLPLGVDVFELLALNDQICELELTPNRADCLSVLGVARETRALYDLTAPLCNPAEGLLVSPAHAASFPTRVEAQDACPRFLTRWVRNLNPHAHTPLWLSERLRRVGVRPIHPVVDATNYVMLELGQPTHAYDHAKLASDLIVRWSNAGESLELLDGQSPLLDANTLVIADASGPVGLAGIMGGRRTAVSTETTAVVLEAAFFAPLAIAGRARNYKLHTDASHRFERGVDPELPRVAMERLTQLILQIAGGEAGPIVVCEAPERLPIASPVLVRHARVERVLGVSLPSALIAERLDKTGSHLASGGEGQWLATPPSHRYDLSLESDFIEEVARLGGYEAIPAISPRASLSMLPQSETSLPRSVLQDLLVQRAYQEAINFAFTDSGLQAQLDPDSAVIPVTNPIAADLDVMRSSLWPGLIRNLITNLNRQVRRVRLFEMGTVFTRDAASGDAIEREQLALLVSGSQLPEQWGEVDRPVDFFDLRADLECMVGGPLDGQAGRPRLKAALHPALHPGQSAALVSASGAIVGWLGRLHPALESKLDLAVSPLLLAADLSCLLVRELPTASSLSRFPASRRDLALVVDATLPVEQLLWAAREAGGTLLTQLNVFDVYTGAGIEKGRKSIALSLIFQDSSSTLSDKQVDDAVARVRGLLAERLGAVIRG